MRVIGTKAVYEHLEGNCYGVKTFATPEEMWEHVLGEVRRRNLKESAAREELEHAYGSLMLHIRRDEAQMLKDAEAALTATVKGADSIDSFAFRGSLEQIDTIRAYRRSWEAIDDMYVSAVLWPILKRQMNEDAAVKE